VGFYILFLHAFRLYLLYAVRVILHVYAIDEDWPRPLPDHRAGCDSLRQASLCFQFPFPHWAIHIDGQISAPELTHGDNRVLRLRFAYNLLDSAYDCLPSLLFDCFRFGLI
jgi:hypothetical protein